jgi:hypothetical protein
MKGLLIVFLLMISTTIFARGGYSGGSRSSFSSSSSRSSFSSSPSRSYFGGSRSSGSPATITRPSVAPTTVINHTTIVERQRGYSGGVVAGAVVGGVLLGHTLAPTRQVVYVNDQPQQVVVEQQQPIIVQQSGVVNTETHWFVGIVIVVFLAAIVYAVVL